MSIYTGLDDYDAMFEARHGRTAVDNSLVISEGVRSISISSGQIPVGTEHQPHMGEMPHHLQVLSKS